jgi:hypothetical protein
MCCMPSEEVTSQSVPTVSHVVNGMLCTCMSTDMCVRESMPPVSTCRATKPVTRGPETHTHTPCTLDGRTRGRRPSLGGNVRQSMMSTRPLGECKLSNQWARHQCAHLRVTMCSACTMFQQCQGKPQCCYPVIEVDSGEERADAKAPIGQRRATAKVRASPLRPKPPVTPPPPYLRPPPPPPPEQLPGAPTAEPRRAAAKVRATPSHEPPTEPMEVRHPPCADGEPRKVRKEKAMRNMINHRHTACALTRMHTDTRPHTQTCTQPVQAQRRLGNRRELCLQTEGCGMGERRRQCTYAWHTASTGTPEATHAHI